MTTKEALSMFDGSFRKLAEALGLSVQAVRQWGDEVPELRAFQLRAIAEKAQ